MPVVCAADMKNGSKNEPDTVSGSFATEDLAADMKEKSVNIQGGEA